MSQEARFTTRLMSFSNALPLVGAAWHITQTLNWANEAFGVKFDFLDDGQHSRHLLYDG